MTTQEWRIPLREAQHEQYGMVLTHGRKPDPKSPSGKRYWYEIDGKSGLDGMPKADIPLYGADRLANATPAEPVVICEGEKATDALLERGVVAVGTVTGANGTPCDASLRLLLGRQVTLWPDNDGSGQAHMKKIADRFSVLGVLDVRLVDWPEAPSKGDAADFLGSDAELRELLAAAIPVGAGPGHPIGATPELDDEPVELGALLDDIRAMITKYVVVTAQQAVAITLWVAHTHVFAAAEATPYLSVTSAEKRSGKTRLLETLDLLVHNPWQTGRTTPAALARKVDKLHPTLLLDESDATFKGNKEYSETLRGMLNSGHRFSGTVTVVVGQGSKMDFEDFSTFCPKAIAGIGDLPDTVTDRSIRIVLKRRAATEPVQRFRHRDGVHEATPIRDRLETWATSSLDNLRDARPDIPRDISDRAAEGWEPLLAIADLAGGEWSERARGAATTLSSGEDDDQSVGVRLLADIETIFRGRDDQPNISTADLLEQLTAMEESPWGDWYGKPLTARGLAKLVRPFDVRPRTVRIGDQTPKGYRREDFTDAWSRYTPDLSATAQHPDSELESIDDEMFGTPNVADSNSPEMQQFELEVADVAAESGFTVEKADDEVLI